MLAQLNACRLGAVIRAGGAADAYGNQDCKQCRQLRQFAGRVAIRSVMA
jgi:hypothetical protein